VDTNGGGGGKLEAAQVADDAWTMDSVFSFMM
jgi:hypothetical protein